MTDHIARVREQAEREAFDRVGAHLCDSTDPQPAKFRSGYRVGFVEGAAWAAARLTREKIAEAMHRQFLVGEIYLSEFERLTAADAILALLVDDTQS